MILYVAIGSFILFVALIALYFLSDDESFKSIGLWGGLSCLFVAIGSGGYWFYKNKRAGSVAKDDIDIDIDINSDTDSGISPVATDNSEDISSDSGRE